MFQENTWTKSLELFQFVHAPDSGCDCSDVPKVNPLEIPGYEILFTSTTDAEVRGS